MKQCIACGMPLRTPADHAAGDSSKDYCALCAQPNGEMKSFDEVLAGMSQFLVTTQGLDPAAARDSARHMMAALPAWKGQR